MSTVFVSSHRRTYIPQSDSPFDSAFFQWESPVAIGGGNAILRECSADMLVELESCVAYLLTMPVNEDAGNLRMFADAVAAELRSR